ncbi:hypothetical protein O181_022716 [Austropuccinia psidii MF-1]|uniref:Uncharacterized protein n=1 Tax=Austropuccinia psidii MF-1 TaxID=1389203 RepID=A0A9Q3CDF3_9BASI|nr:hypothetical protein [Austropuccinia psidii MF-1]
MRPPQFHRILGRSNLWLKSAGDNANGLMCMTIFENKYCYTHKCWHCSVKIVVTGCHTSNMNKNFKICAGRFNACASKLPVSIDPNMVQDWQLKPKQYFIGS